jgi:hypothetical protein
MPTIYTNKKQCHLRLCPSRLTLEKHSLPMLTVRTFLIRTRLLSVLFHTHKRRYEGMEIPELDQRRHRLLHPLFQRLTFANRYGIRALERRFQSSHSVDMHRGDACCLDPRVDKECCCIRRRYGGTSWVMFIDKLQFQRLLSGYFRLKYIG